MILLTCPVSITKTLNKFTVLNWPTLQSHVTNIFEEKTFGRCPASQEILKSVTFQYQKRKFSLVAKSCQIVKVMILSKKTWICYDKLMFLLILLISMIHPPITLIQNIFAPHQEFQYCAWQQTWQKKVMRSCDASQKQCVTPSNILRYNQVYLFVGSRFKFKHQSSPKSLSECWEPMF